MASITNFIPANELEKKKKTETSKEKESRLNSDSKPPNDESDKEPSEKEKNMKTTASMDTCFDEDKNKEAEEEYDDDDDFVFFFNYEDIPKWYEEAQDLGYSTECHLLHGAIAPPPPWIASPIHQQADSQSAVDDASFVTKERFINPSLVAERAAHEVFALALDKDGLFWTNDGTVLNQRHYEEAFPRPNPTPPPPNSWTHASRAITLVNMEPFSLIKLLTSGEKWVQLFTSIVSEDFRIRFLRHGSSYHNPDGSLQLVYTELQALTPYVPKRMFCLLRTLKQFDELTWVVADMSVDGSRNIGYPCGCLIRGVADGFSQVIWVEHLEFEESYMDKKLYTDLSCRGFAFGAERWVACLERYCERRSYQTKTGLLVPCLVQEYPGQYEKKYVMEVSQMMVHRFCLDINPFEIGCEPPPRISSVPSLRDMQICSVLTESPYYKDPKEMVLISTTTFSLPYSPEVILEILGDEHRRHEWDLSGKICPLKKPTCYTTGNDSRNKISLYQTYSWLGNQVVLQEASVNRCGSLLVWGVLKSDDFVRISSSHVRLPVIELSGLAISSNRDLKTTSSSSSGSVVTLVVRQEAQCIKELEAKRLHSAEERITELAERLEAVLNTRTSPQGVCGSNRTFYQISWRPAAQPNSRHC